MDDEGDMSPRSDDGSEDGGATPKNKMALHIQNMADKKEVRERCTTLPPFHPPFHRSTLLTAVVLVLCRCL